MGSSKSHHAPKPPKPVETEEERRRRRRRRGFEDTQRSRTAAILAGELGEEGTIGQQTLLGG